MQCIDKLRLFCLIFFQDDYSFEFNNNILILNAGSLKYAPNRVYEIFVSTESKNALYTQIIRIKIEHLDDLPIVGLE